MLIFLIYVGSITSGGWEGRTEGHCDPLPVTRSPTCLCFSPCFPPPPHCIIMTPVFRLIKTCMSPAFMWTFCKFSFHRILNHLFPVSRGNYAMRKLHVMLTEINSFFMLSNALTRIAKPFHKENLLYSTEGTFDSWYLLDGVKLLNFCLTSTRQSFETLIKFI